MSNFEIQMGQLTIPVTPYAGTSGWSGSETSRERAMRQDADGTTKNNQTAALRLVLASKSFGITWKELSDQTGWHHGTASGVLSNLHKGGLIERLVDRRNRCAIYVGAQSVNDRQVVKAESVKKEDKLREKIAKEIENEYRRVIEASTTSVPLAVRQVYFDCIHIARGKND